MTEQTVDSTADERVANNLMRHQYRVLDEAEKLQMQSLKDKGLDFVLLLHGIGKTDPNGPQGSRELALAQTKIEEAVMWAVKHVTG